MSPSSPAVIFTHSIVSRRTGRGVVVVEWDGKSGQFDPEDARKFAHTILRECDNAETDAFLYANFSSALNPDAARILLVKFRAERAKLEQLAGLRLSGQPVPEEDAR